MGAVLDSSGAQNAIIGWDIVIAAGTWNVSFMHVQSTNRGIYTVAVDAVSAGTVDGYAATTWNVIGTVTGVVVAATAKKRLTFEMATKNASSSGYTGSLVAVSLLRTA
jgi:hypothetical protein